MYANTIYSNNIVDLPNLQMTNLIPRMHNMYTVNSKRYYYNTCDMWSGQVFKIVQKHLISLPIDLL